MNHGSAGSVTDVGGVDVRAGFIGLGDQGMPMARRIGRSGLPTTVWARRSEVARRAGSEWGAAVAGTPAVLGGACDVVGICVFDAEGVAEVLFGQDGLAAGMADGGIVLVHSTVSPGEIGDIAERALPHGITVLDAPVSGGARAADNGDLLVMLAGPAAAADQAMPVIECFAGQVVRLGEVGAASFVKLCDNALLAAQVALVADILDAGRQHGVDKGLLDVLRLGSSRGFAVDQLAAAGSVDALAHSRFASTIDKDVRLLADTLGRYGRWSTVLDLAGELSRQMDAKGAARRSASHDRDLSTA